MTGYCGEMTCELIGSGTTKGMPAKIAKVKWADTWNPQDYKKCSYVHFAIDKEYGVLNDIITSQSCELNAGCFACGSYKFQEAIKLRGYVGSLPN